MHKGQWDDYDRYLVMADNCNKIAPNYGDFCEFRKVLRALKKIVETHNDQWYDFEGNRYKKEVNNSNAKFALRDFENATYNDSMGIIAKQIGVRLKDY